MTEDRAKLTELPDELLRWTDPAGSQGVEDLISDSRQAGPGKVFFALRGLRTDGHQYLDAVAKAGAFGAVVEAIDPDVDLPQVIVPDTARALALSAARFYDTAHPELPYVAVTGTAGKTTTSTMIASLLEALLGPPGLITTAGIYHPAFTQTEVEHTTPDTLTLHKTVRQLLDLGSSALIIEASSHGIEQQRIGGLPFRCAVFTNLSNEHMDYHKTMEAYAAAKAKLFEQLPKDGMAVVNLTDPWTPRILEGCQARVIGFALADDLVLLDETREGAALMQRCEVILTADQLSTNTNGTLSFELSKGPQEHVRVQSKVIGSFNVLNLMAAAGVGIAMGFKLDRVAPLLEDFRGVVGRQELIDLGQPYRVMLDFAHTPAALQTLLRAVKPMVQGRLHLVFAVAGDRDRVKRPEMARIAAEYADSLILTLQKTLNEPPLQIMQDLEQGLADKDYQKIPLRPEAIRTVMNQAEAGDLVVVIGVMSTDHLSMGGRDYAYRDREVVEQAIVERQMREALAAAGLELNDSN